ncbi:retrovirus-related Pol polyprotein from transposon 17.6 [Trichonephila clavata]|uniref:Retrovirus-related Pol polyprotein from transposon 17.6 n=1 Tax=Trichonephila clavata TaxID=2740835 RepID=A0A8X6HU06_TRICU|nr:retrovirus-related Pol polyprotein from transposon 17.6 [Trichonephila clavata]
MQQFEETNYLIDTDQNSEQIESDRVEEEEVNSENKEILPPVNPFSPISPVTQIPSSTFIATQQKSEELAPIISEVVNKTNVDACEPMPTFTEGNKEIIKIRSLASKYPDAIPVPDKTSKSVIHALLQVFGRMGFPRKIYSDKGKSIMSLLTVKFFKKVGIKMSRCSIFPPQGNSMERFHRSVKRILKASCIDAAILFGVKLKRYINKQIEFYIQTDHNPLVWLKNNAGNNGRLLRWALSLQSFNFTIMHKKGKDNLNVDCLSRNSLHAD